MKRRSNLIWSGVCLAFLLWISACTSSLSQLNRRPFSNKVGFIALRKGPYEPSSPVTFRHDVCNKKWFGIFGSAPEFQDVKRELAQEKRFKYLTNVTSLEYTESGFLGGNICVGFEGEGHK